MSACVSLCVRMCCQLAFQRVHMPIHSFPIYLPGGAALRVGARSVAAQGRGWAHGGPRWHRRRFMPHARTHALHSYALIHLRRMRTRAILTRVNPNTPLPPPPPSTPPLSPPLTFPSPFVPWRRVRAPHLFDQSVRQARAGALLPGGKEVVCMCVVCMRQ